MQRVFSNIFSNVVAKGYRLAHCQRTLFSGLKIVTDGYTLTTRYMYQCSLHFCCTSDICSFIKGAQLRNFLLLGKKSILMANYPEAALRMAKEKYNASLVESPELWQTAGIYFQKSIGKLPNAN